MDVAIYMKRAEELDGLASRIIEELKSASSSADDDSRKALMREFEAVSKVEAENAKILLESERNNLKDREIDQSEAEVAVRRDEAAVKVKGDHEKLEVEEKAVKARVIGEVLKVGGTVVGVAGTLVGLKMAMGFEKADEGGILPTKFITTIFRMSN